MLLIAFIYLLLEVVEQRLDGGVLILVVQSCRLLGYTAYFKWYLRRTESATSSLRSASAGRTVAPEYVYGQLH